MNSSLSPAHAYDRPPGSPWAHRARPSGPPPALRPVGPLRICLLSAEGTGPGGPAGAAEGVGEAPGAGEAPETTTEAATGAGGPVEAVLAAYGDHLWTWTRSAQTRRCYLARARQFCGWLDAAGRLGELSDPVALSRAARRWLAENREERSWAPATVNAAAGAIGNFATWLGAEPVGFRAERVPRRAPRALSDDELDRVTAAATALGAREAALVALMASSGLRVGEVSGLGTADVAGRTVTVRRGKGGHWREVVMTASVEAALARWLAERPGGPGALFPGESGSARGLSTRRIAELMDRVGERAGVAFSPHQLRHSFASRLVRAGVDVVAVAELLGHNSLQYVATYSRPTEAALRAILDAVETPRGPG